MEIEVGRGKGLRTVRSKLPEALVFILILFVFFCSNAASGESRASSLLAVPPFLGRPSQNSITINLVTGEKDIMCQIRYRPSEQADASDWKITTDFPVDAFTAEEVKLDSLFGGRGYEYQVYARPRDSETFQMLSEHRFRTKASNPPSFSFAILSDSHITPFHKERLDILSQASESILIRRPDFFFMLGDNIQTFTSHGGPMTEERFGPLLYSLLRRGLGATPSSVPGFLVIGNWEGENGWHPETERRWAAKARRAFIPNPGPDTYTEGGGEKGDYYGFTWGEVLFLVLNVTGYTLTDHTHGSRVGNADDWTLGERQKEWLLGQLSRSTARWKLLFIHHTVGGKAGDDLNSRYGRGGGRAAHVGEQALIHQWMREHGVQALFYGHDHVFTDMEVEGIHYICVGSAGAPWKFTEAETGYSRYWTPSGYTWVDVAKDSLKVSFVEPGSGETGDRIMHSFLIHGR